MLRKTFFIVLLLSIWNIAVAQSLSKAQIRKEVNSLSEEYSLTDAQKDKVAEIVKKREKDIKAIMKDDALSNGVKRRKKDAIQSGSSGSILLLLDEEQRKALFEKKMAKAKEVRLEKSKN